jgi:hypothetical protein
MAEQKKPFGELVKDAPLASQESTVSLVGTLARSSEQGKFVLTLSPGNSVTLDVSAVKDYKELSGAVGQSLVQVEVDRAKLPENVLTNAPLANSIPAYELKSPVADRTVPLTDIFTLPVIDRSTRWYLDDPFTVPIVDYGVKDIAEGLPSDPGDPYAGGVPFALATAHQAPQEALAMAQGAQANFYTAPALDTTLAWRDVKNPASDVTHPLIDVKRPWLDATGRPPYLD